MIWNRIVGLSLYFCVAYRIPCATASLRRYDKSRFSAMPNNPVEVTRIEVDYGEADDHRNLQEVSEDPTYAPIRISFDTRPLESRLGESDNLDAKIETLLSSILPATAEKWQQHISVRPVRGGLALPPQICDGIYDQYLTKQIVYEEVDLIILVGGEQEEDVCLSETTNTLAYAYPCGSDQLDRPVVGAINFCLSSTPSNGEYLISALPTFENIELAKDFEDATGAIFRADHLRLRLLDIAVHEVGHILGQNAALYPYFRDASNLPRTPRVKESHRSASLIRRCSDGKIRTGEFPADSTIRVVEQDDFTYRHYLVTPRVRIAAQNHFGCPELQGARLNDFDGECIGSHWHEREFFSNLMGPVVNDSSENDLSILTLALMEDSGWYQVDYRGASQPAFGLGAGCDFIQADCIQNNEVPVWGSSDFCTTPLLLDGKSISDETLNHVYCDPAHNSWTVCDLADGIDNSRLRDTERAYFDDPNLFPFVSTGVVDWCPTPSIGLGLDCRLDDRYNAFYPGERVGAQSRCVNAFYEEKDKQKFQPACMVVTCDVEKGEVVVGEGEFAQTCTSEGEIIPFVGRDGSSFVCPRLAALCPEIFACSDGCFARGECIYPDDKSLRPYCKCFDDTNDDPSCAPPYITQNSTASPATMEDLPVPPYFFVPPRAPEVPVVPTKSPSIDSSSSASPGPSVAQHSSIATSTPVSWFNTPTMAPSERLPTLRPTTHPTIAELTDHSISKTISLAPSHMNSTLSSQNTSPIASPSPQQQGSLPLGPGPGHDGMGMPVLVLSAAPAREPSAASPLSTEPQNISATRHAQGTVWHACFLVVWFAWM